MADVKEILQARKSQHGDFSDHARITCELKAVMEDQASWERLHNVQKEALHMIVHKIGRVLAGNPDHHDHWDDIAGYATLVSQRIPPVGICQRREGER